MDFVPGPKAYILGSIGVEWKMQSNGGVGPEPGLPFNGSFSFLTSCTFSVPPGGPKFFYFFFFQYPGSRRCLLQGSHWLGHSLGKSGFRLPQEKDGNEFLISNAQARTVTHRLLYKQEILPSAPLLPLVVS